MKIPMHDGLVVEVFQGIGDHDDLHSETLSLCNQLRSLLSSMSSCGFCQIPTGKSEFRGIPWTFYGKHLAGASAIWVSISMEIPTFFQGIPMEMVAIREPQGMIPNGIHGNPLEFC